MSISLANRAEAVTPGLATRVGPPSTVNSAKGPGDLRDADPITDASLEGSMDPAEASAEAGGAAGRGPAREDTGSPGTDDVEDPAELKGADPTAGASNRRGQPERSRRAALEGEDPGPDRLLDRCWRGLPGRTRRASALGQRPGPDRRPLRRRNLALPGGGNEEGGENPP